MNKAAVIRQKELKNLVATLTLKDLQELQRVAKELLANTQSPNMRNNWEGVCANLHDLVTFPNLKVTGEGCDTYDVSFYYGSLWNGSPFPHISCFLGLGSSKWEGEQLALRQGFLRYLTKRLGDRVRRLTA
ncbi:MAG: hypothetical protein ACOH2T_19155 [Pseudomonas sp.]